MQFQYYLTSLVSSAPVLYSLQKYLSMMYNMSQGSQGILNKSNYEQKYRNFCFSSPKADKNMGVSVRAHLRPGHAMS